MRICASRGIRPRDFPGGEAAGAYLYVPMARVGEARSRVAPRDVAARPVSVVAHLGIDIRR